VKDSRIYLAQILECLVRILEYTKGGKVVFDAEPMVRDAVIRNFEIIGEAAKRVPQEFRDEHPTIPWRGLSGFRDALIHQYEGIDYDEVWRIIDRDVHPIREAVEHALPPLDELERELNGDDAPD
jgi:uncharacterized protein with HEPN domain